MRISRRELCVGLALFSVGCSRRAPEPEPAPEPELKPALPRELTRAFQRQPGFEELGKPKEGEWRDAHPEPGQSVSEFQRATRVVPTPERRTLFILPIGAFEAGHGPPMDVLLDYVRRYFGLEAEVLPALTDRTALRARSRTRGKVTQLSSGDLLDALREKLPPNAYGLVGVTMSDLFPDPSWNYVFDEARFNERVGVYSFARYDPQFHGELRDERTEHVILTRSLKVMTHEIGHMFGIAHCNVYRCLMNGSNSLAETDRAPMHVCFLCLRKLHLAVGFDPASRYTTLAAFYRAHGFAEEAGWVDQRLAYLRSE